METRFQGTVFPRGALRLVEESSGKIVQLNQELVREIPTVKAYDEIDLLPYKHHIAKPHTGQIAKAIPVPLPQKPLYQLPKLYIQIPVLVQDRKVPHS